MFGLKVLYLSRNRDAATSSANLRIELSFMGFSFRRRVWRFSLPWPRNLCMRHYRIRQAVAGLPTGAAVGEGRFLMSMYACLMFFVIVILLACRLQRR